MSICLAESSEHRSGGLCIRHGPCVPCSVLSGSLCTAVNSMADYNAAGVLMTARSGKIARRPSMKRRHSFDLSKRRSFLAAPGRKSLDVRPHCSSLAGVCHFFLAMQ